MIVRQKRHSPEQARAITEAIRHAFPHGPVAPEVHESLIGSVPGPDADDRVHGAAATAGDAATLITPNTRHLNAGCFEAHGVVVDTPEAYLLRRLASAPEPLVQTVQRVIASKRQPPWTTDEYLKRLQNAGAPRSAAALRPRRAMTDTPAWRTQHRRLGSSW